MTGEQEPQPSIEARVLTELGYEHCLDTPLGEGGTVIGRHFLDVYRSADKRQETEDLLHGFADMSTDDPDYEPTKAYITRYLAAYFGPPQAQ
jgi:hypothetical protein